MAATLFEDDGEDDYLIPDVRVLREWRNEGANRVVGFQNGHESRRLCTTGRSGCDL